MTASPITPAELRRFAELDEKDFDDRTDREDYELDLFTNKLSGEEYLIAQTSAPLALRLADALDRVAELEAAVAERNRRLARYDEAVSLLRRAVPFMGCTGGWYGYEETRGEIAAFLAAEPERK